MLDICQGSPDKSGSGAGLESGAERRAGFNPKARAMVPFHSSSVPIPLAVQGHPLAQTDRTQKEDEMTAQNNLLFFTN